MNSRRDERRRRERAAEEGEGRGRKRKEEQEKEREMGVKEEGGKEGRNEETPKNIYNHSHGVREKS